MIMILRGITFLIGQPYRTIIKLRKITVKNMMPAALKILITSSVLVCRIIPTYEREIIKAIAEIIKIIGRYKGNFH
jgi:hypothetical protein